MGFFTRLPLSDLQTKQSSGDTLTLSGETNFTGILKSKDVEIDASTGSSSIGDILTWDGTKISLAANSGSGSDIYTGASPSNIEVGGMPIGTVLTGRSISNILQEILIQTFNPILTNPNNTLAEDQANTQEVGTTIGTINFTATFSRGSISPQYTAASPFRSGLPNNYNYTGAQIAGSYASTLLTDNRSAINYKLLLGANTWTGTVSYDAGVQPYDSAGNPYSTPLVAGTTGSKSVTLTGTYMIFYGETSATPINSTQVRALPQNDFVTVNPFILNTGTVNNRFTVALPPGTTISAVFDLNVSADITSSYVYLGTITVNDGGGSGDPHSYNLYEMNPAIPYGTNHQHRITTV